MRYENQKMIGQVLKNQRVKKHQTLAEVSGAAEIEIETLSKIEAGNLLPDEELLITLISYLKIPDDAAQDIFIIAGYFEEETDRLAQPGMPAIYADSTNVINSRDGVIIDFSQPSIDGQMNTFRFGLNQNVASELTKQLMQSLTKENKPRRITSVAKYRGRTKK